MMFKKVWKSLTSYKILQLRDDGNSRYVNEDYGQYVAWLSAGNIPEEVPYVQPVIEPPVELDPWEDVRNRRNKLLLDSDWTQLDDCPLDKDIVKDWRTYRQALRDITKQDDPRYIVWPVPPT